MVEKGPFEFSLENTDNIVFQELRTYRLKDNEFRVDVATRSFFKDGDYNDTVSYKPMAILKNKETPCSCKSQPKS
jgi:hypothetical protein